MKRRDVLKAGAIGAATVATGAVSLGGGAGCAATPHVGDPAADDRAAQAFLALLDKSLARTEGARPIDQLSAKTKPGPRTPETQQGIDARDHLMRGMLRSLFITQTFRDLPVETQLHPAVQERMSSHMDEIDGTVFALSDFLAGQTPEQRARLHAALAKSPDAAMQISEKIDEQAAAVGVSKPRRRQLRAMMTQATFRMKTEPAGALIDEYTEKVERLRGQDGTSALALALSRKLGEKAFWSHQQRLAQAGPGATAPVAGPASNGAPPPSNAPGAPTTTPPGETNPFLTERDRCLNERSAIAQRAAATPDLHERARLYESMPECSPGPQTVEADPHPSTPPLSHPSPPAQPGHLVRTGGYMLGIGVATFGVSAALVGASDVFLIGMTVGALLFAIGFIVLIVGIIVD